MLSEYSYLMRCWIEAGISICIQNQVRIFFYNTHKCIILLIPCISKCAEKLMYPKVLKITYETFHSRAESHKNLSSFTYFMFGLHKRKQTLSRRKCQFKPRNSPKFEVHFLKHNIIHNFGWI